MATLQGVGALPDRVVAGWRRLEWLGRLELLLAGTLIVAFALSSDSAGVPAALASYAFFVYMLQLLAAGAWLGGLFYLAIILLPVSLRLNARQRARMLALDLDAFGALALVGAAIFAVTGALNAKIRLGSIQDLLATTYGRTFIVEFELWLIMVAISAYLVLYLRPRLAMEVGDETRTTPASTAGSDLVEIGAGARSASGSRKRGNSSTASEPPTPGHRAPEDNRNHPLSPHATSLEERIRDWLRRQALLGGAVLLCLALLGIFAGSLMSAAPGPVGSANATPTPFSGQHSIAGLDMRLTVTPDAFGPNTFTVAVKDISGKPVTDALVFVTITSTDMDMGVENPQLQPIAGTPGSYSAEANITMAGNWQAVVAVTAPGTKTSIQATFLFSAGY